MGVLEKIEDIESEHDHSVNVGRELTPYRGDVSE
jgi:hypothetical protein